MKVQVKFANVQNQGESQFCKCAKSRRETRIFRLRFVPASIFDINYLKYKSNLSMYKIKAEVDFVQNQGEKQDFLDSDLYQPPSWT